MAAYERVAEAIRRDIRSGALKPGEKIPSHRDLATRYDVALGTAQKALQVLQDDDWLTARPSVGVFVNEPDDSNRPPTLEEVSRQLGELQAALEDLAQRVQRIEGTSPAG